MLLKHFLSFTPLAAILNLCVCIGMCACAIRFAARSFFKRVSKLNYLLFFSVRLVFSCSFYNFISEHIEFTFVLKLADKWTCRRHRRLCCWRLPPHTVMSWRLHRWCFNISSNISQLKTANSSFLQLCHKKRLITLLLFVSQAFFRLHFFFISLLWHPNEINSKETYSIISFYLV